MSPTTPRKPRKPGTPTRSTARRRAHPGPDRRPAGVAFDRLVGIMATLRSRHGCAWDRKQTHETLRGYLLEETYEAVDAIDAGDLEGLRGELGDVLLQCVFHAQLGREAGRFDITAVVDGIAEKLIRRHPHIFAPDGRRLLARERARHNTSTPDAVREQWARIKASEQADAGQSSHVLAGIPRALPALLRAHKISARAAAVGFDWPRAEDVMTKIEEEVRELRDALTESHARAADEMGDLLFSIANLARRLGLEPESTLAAASDKFTARFNAVESLLESSGRTVHDASLDELEAAWTTVKQAATLSPSTTAPPTSASTPSSRRTRSTRRRPDPS
jgi:ATP diphosphatase